MLNDRSSDKGFWEPICNVMVGNGESRDSSPTGHGYHLLRRMASIRIRGMEMKVNACHGVRN